MKRLFLIAAIGIVAAFIIVALAFFIEPSDGEKIIDKRYWCIYEITHDGKPLDVTSWTSTFKINNCNSTMTFSENGDLKLPSTNWTGSDAGYELINDSLKVGWLSHDREVMEGTYCIVLNKDHLTLKSKRTTIKAVDLSQ